MTTIETLMAAGHLVRIDTDPDGGTQPWRLVYGTPDFIRWLDEVLPTLTTHIVGGILTPMQQVDTRLAEFGAGAPLRMPYDFHPLIPNQHAAWEMKTDEVRIFGWFPSRDCFIATHGAPADNVKASQLYGTLRNECVRVRAAMNLTCGHILGTNYHDVVSDRP
jgi:hypothetical protein